MQNQSSFMLNNAKSSFNLLKEWQDSRSTEKEYRRQGNRLMRQTAFETQKIRDEGIEERGEALAKAGASGIDISSFNDALLANDLKKSREIYDKDTQAREEKLDLQKKAKSERRGRKLNLASFSIGLLPGFTRF